MITANYTAIAKALFEALQKFDCDTEPQGLYAAEEHGVEKPRKKWELEWSSCLKPCLEAEGAQFALRSNLDLRPYRLQHVPFAAEGHFNLPGLGRIDLSLIRISKIKVRLFGNTYRIDPHEDFSERWSQLKLGSFLKHSRQDQPKPYSGKTILLLLGFDGHRDPLQKELSAMKEERNWDRFGWNLHSHSWPDPHHRAFYTRASIWTPQQ